MNASFQIEIDPAVVVPADMTNLCREYLYVRCKAQSLIYWRERLTFPFSGAVHLIWVAVSQPRQWLPFQVRDWQPTDFV